MKESQEVLLFFLGECMQAKDEPDRVSVNVPRVLDYLCLRKRSIQKLGHDPLHLPTNKIINHNMLFDAPIVIAILNQVCMFAASDSGTKGLKISNQTRKLRWDSSFTLRVEYESYLDHNCEQEFDSSKELNINGLGDESLEKESRRNQSPKVGWKKTMIRMIVLASLKASMIIIVTMITSIILKMMGTP